VPLLGTSSAERRETLLPRSSGTLREHKFLHRFN
jgi:hypothetical protein